MSVKSVAVKILVAVAVLLALFVLAVVTRPDAYRVSRSTLVSAPAPVVFAQVNDFHNWPTWNPWGKIDPAMRQTYGGAPLGTGATYAWAGNNKVGEGRMTITESQPDTLVRIKLEFLKPFASLADAEFTFQPQGGLTAVTWTMAGKNTFMGKVIQLFMSMDKMIGSQFEKGLADLRTAAEKAAGQAP